jgi:hypothetical protein
MTRSAVVSFLIVLLLFGFAVPYWKGLDFLDAFLLLMSCCVPLVLVAPTVAGSFHPGDVASQVIRTAGYSWILALLILVNGIGIINLTHRFGSLLIPPVGFLAGALAMNLTCGLFLAAETALLIRRIGSQGALRRVRFSFFAVLIAVVFYVRFAPSAWQRVISQLMTSEGVMRLLACICVLFAALTALIWKKATAPASNTA